MGVRFSHPPPHNSLVTNMVYRIYDPAPYHSKTRRNSAKGRKKKFRRKVRAYNVDGYERKRAGGLAPMHMPSKHYLDLGEVT